MPKNKNKITNPNTHVLENCEFNKRNERKKAVKEMNRIRNSNDVVKCVNK